MKADLILNHARINTFDPRHPQADSLAALHGRILAVGQEHEFAHLIGAETTCIDVGGRTVLPGLIDAHQHLSWFSEEPLKLNCGQAHTPSLKALRTAVAQAAANLSVGEWIRGVNYDDTKMAEARLLSRDDLDEAAPDHPVIVVHISGHWAVVNSAALACGGFDRHSPDPDGGSLGRASDSGRLDGRLFEMAMFNFAFESLAVGPTVVPPFARDVRLQALRKATGVLNAAGITGVGDALCSPSYITTYHDLLREGGLSVRVNMIIPYIFLDYLENLGLVGGWGNAWVRASGIKIIVDGAIAGRTAALTDGYANAPDDHGLLLIAEQAKLDRIVERIHASGYQACIHANGDVAIDMALTAIERAQQAAPRPDTRHRIEHCTIIDDALLARMAALKVMALPFTSYIWQHGEKLRPFYGRRADRMFAHKSFLDAGVAVATGSDHPVGLLSPLMGVQCMVTRRTADGEVVGAAERLSVDEALRVYTVYAAYASFEEHVKGRLAPGYLADAVVLDQDPWDVAPECLADISVDMTIVGGRVVYDRNAPVA